MSYPTPPEAIGAAIGAYEGGWQAMPNDQGNWVRMPIDWEPGADDITRTVYINGEERIERVVGTMRGVIPNTYARYLRVAPWTITAEQMQREITPEVAVDVGVTLFYQRPGFDRLEWSPLAWITVDCGWASGPRRGKRLLQAALGVYQDGIIGPVTTAHYHRAIREDIWAACQRMADVRAAYYTKISNPRTHPHNAGFRGGWLRRAREESPKFPPFRETWADWRPDGARATPYRPEPPSRPAPPTRSAPRPVIVPRRRSWLARLFGVHL